MLDIYCNGVIIDSSKQNPVTTFVKVAFD